MEPHQQRVLQEKQELDERLFKLRLFMEKQAFVELDSAEQDRMAIQALRMKAYSDILGERIDAWSE